MTRKILLSCGTIFIAACLILSLISILTAVYIYRSSATPGMNGVQHLLAVVFEEVPAETFAIRMEWKINGS